MKPVSAHRRSLDILRQQVSRRASAARIALLKLRRKPELPPLADKPDGTRESSLNDDERQE
jgi:hypothetical protein